MKTFVRFLIKIEIEYLSLINLISYALPSHNFETDFIRFTERIVQVELLLA